MIPEFDGAPFTQAWKDALWPLHHLLQSRCPLAKAGVWDWPFTAVSRAYDGDLQMVDSSPIRVHQHAAKVKKGARRQPALGNSTQPDAWGARAAN